MSEKKYIQLDGAKVQEKGGSEKGVWIEVSIFTEATGDIELRDIFFPYSQIKIDKENEIWVTDWILGEKEKDKLKEGEGILTQ